MIPNTDSYIKLFLAWCHANPITVALLAPLVAAMVKKTKNTYDDWLLKRLQGATRHGSND